MGLFRKKKKAVIKKSFINALNEVLAKEDTKISNYLKLKPRLSKFVAVYKYKFDPYVYAHGDTIQIKFNKDFDYSTDYPDGFFALADKLGLNIEPICNSGYSADNGKRFNVRAKSK